MSEQFNEILLFSGGLDSYIAWHYLGKPKTLHFMSNTKYGEEEARVVRELIPDTVFDHSLDFRGREEGEKAYIPYRNLLFACQAAKYAPIIYMAGVRDDVVNDKNPSAFSDFSSILTRYSKNENKHSVLSPFWNSTKSEVVRWYLTSGHSAENLLKTISCYAPSEGRNYCGACPSCYRKTVALWDNGITDLYFHNTPMVMDYYRKALRSEYYLDRCASIKRYTEWYAKTNQITIKEPKVFIFDIDGTLTVETQGYGPEVYAQRTPRFDMISHVNKLYEKGNEVIIWTSRHEQDIVDTIMWLKRYGVKYTELRLEKPHYHRMVCDRTIHPDRVTSVEDIENESGN